jgi:hypothetical protein
MSVMANLLRRTALTLVASAAIALPMAANASLTDGLSIRAGFFHPTSSNTNSLTDFAAWGGGLEYKVGWVPQVFNGEHWSTSISADVHYSERGGAGNGRILRYIPVMINQVYNFEEQNGHAPYAGFSLGAATFGVNGAGAVRQPTVTRVAGGLILGLNWTKNFYLEGRYEWVDKSGVNYDMQGFRGYLGYRF